MSISIKKCRERSLTDIVFAKDGKFYYVDSCYTLDRGWETMVFPCDSHGEVENWIEVFAEWYNSIEDMINGHHYVCCYLEECLKKYAHRNEV